MVEAEESTGQAIGGGCVPGTLYVGTYVGVCPVHVHVHTCK